MKNVGTLLDTSTNDDSKTNAQMSYGYNDTLFADATNGVIDFNSPMWLADGKSVIAVNKIGQILMIFNGTELQI